MHCDTLLQIEGFNEEDTEEFIFKYFSSQAVIGDLLPVSHHPACNCVLADPYTQAYIGCHGELVAEFACLAELLWHQNQNWDGHWLSSSEFEQQFENIYTLNVQGLADTLS